MSDIPLTASIRSNLLSLQNASRLLDITSERLSTGKKVNSAIDNPGSFFTARGLSNRAADLVARKDGLGQAISLLTATDKSIASITSLVEQAKATAQSAEEASTSGVTAVSSVAGSFVASGEIAASSIRSEATVVTTTDSATFTLAGTITNANGSSTMTQFTGVALTAGDTVTYTTLGFGKVTTGGTNAVVLTGAQTLTQVAAALSGLDGITATVVGTGISVAAAGGTLLRGSDTANVNFIDELGGVITDGTSTATTTAIVSTNVVTFNLAGDGTDLAAAAFVMTDADSTAAFTYTIDGAANSTVAAALNQTVDAYAATINISNAAIAATFDDTTNRIIITGTNGSNISFTNTAAFDDLGLVVASSTTAIIAATNYGFDDGTAIAATDLLGTVFNGLVATDTLTFGVTGGSDGTAFTTRAAATIQDLLDAINSSDSALTAFFDTASGKISVTAANGTAVKITQGGSSGAFGGLGFTTGTTTLTTGTAVTFGAAGSTAEVGSLNTDFQSILEQIDLLFSDSSFKGINLLKGGSSSTVTFNADGTSSFTIAGLDFGVTGNTNFNFTRDASGYDFTTAGDITQALTDTAAAVAQLRTVSATFGANLGVIQTREDFTTNLVNVLETGAGKLVNANLEEESANLLALQTRQALGIQALSISNQSNQSILSLFR